MAHMFDGGIFQSKDAAIVITIAVLGVVDMCSTSFDFDGKDAVWTPQDTVWMPKYAFCNPKNISFFLAVAAFRRGHNKKSNLLEKTP